VAIDSIEEMGLGFIVGTVVLLVLGRITPEMPWSEIVGKIVLEAMVVAIGVSVGTAQLGDAANQGADSSDGEQSSQATDQGSVGAEQESRQVGGQLVIACCGAMLFAANIAPTEEVRVIAAEISSWNLLALECLSLAICALILYYAEFRSARRFVPTNEAPAVLVGTVVTYAVALVTSGLMLWFYGVFDELNPVTSLSQTVVLAFPAALGASAGRLLLE
jgi:putative integral membrane protein (TIGR02587 family)